MKTLGLLFNTILAAGCLFLLLFIGGYVFETTHFQVWHVVLLVALPIGFGVLALWLLGRLKLPWSKTPDEIADAYRKKKAATDVSQAIAAIAAKAKSNKQD